MDDAVRGESQSGSGDNAAPLEVTTSRDARGTPLIHVSGEIDMSNVDALKEAVYLLTAERSVEVEAMRARAPDRLIFDLSSVTFIDSRGLAALAAATNRVDAVVLRKPSAAVRRTVDLVGLTHLVQIED